MKKIIFILSLIAFAFTGQAQNVQFSLHKVSNTSVALYFKSNVAIGPVTTGISNLTFVLQLPQTFANPDALYTATPNSTYLGTGTHQTVTSTANGSMWNTLFSYTSNPNIAGTTFAAGTEYLLVTIDLPATVTASDIILTDWGNNQINNNTGAPLFATSLAIDGVDRTNDAAIFYQSTSSNPPVNSGTATLQSTAAIPVVPLGLKLLNFEGSLINKNVFLKWVTTNEVNTNRFDIERSADARSWAKVGQKNASGNTAINVNYDYTDDVNGLAGTIYYRLKMLDNDESYAYSNILTFNLGKENDSYVKVYPTVVVKGENVNISFSQNYITGNIVVLNSVGQVVKREQLPDSKSLSIGTGDLAMGTYFVKLVNAHAYTDLAKFIVR